MKTTKMILLTAMLMLPVLAIAGDATIKLPSANGADAFIVQDTYGASLMRVDSSGQISIGIGIGTNALKTKLSIQGNESTVPGVGRTIINLRDANDTVKGWNVGTFGTASYEGAFKFGINRSVANMDGTVNPSGGNKFLIDTNGNIGMGLTTPRFPLHMASGAHVTVGGVWTNASSRDLKENIQPVTTAQALKTLNGLQPMLYNYKVDKSEQYVGFIAEDVPELVATNDRKSLAAMDVVAVLTKVVQEQQTTISELKTDKIMQKQRMKALEQRVEMLTRAMVSDQVAIAEVQ